jgi:hypothetical protein
MKYKIGLLQLVPSNKIILIMILVSFYINSCGTLGGFDNRNFPIGKSKLLQSFDHLYEKYPEYIIPKKWETFNDWHERGYDFLQGKIVYFKNQPEEMYYISFIGDSIEQSIPYKCSIAIRAICKGTNKWNLENDFSKDEKERIENRFDKEIISKLEILSNSKSTRVSN